MFENAYWSNLVDENIDSNKVDIDLNIFSLKDSTLSQMSFLLVYNIYRLFLCVLFVTTGVAVKKIIHCPSKSNVSI